MTSILKSISAIVAVLTTMVVVSAAQDFATPGQGKAAERIEQFKKLRMMEILDLDEQTSIKFFARYNKNLEIMKMLRQKQVKALGRIQDLRKGKASDSEFGSVISELQALDEQINQAKSKYINELKDVLTNKQLAEYLVFELRFQQNLRDLIRDVLKNR